MVCTATALGSFFFQPAGVDLLAADRTRWRELREDILRAPESSKITQAARLLQAPIYDSPNMARLKLSLLDELSHWRDLERAASVVRAFQTEAYASLIDRATRAVDIVEYHGDSLQAADRQELQAIITSARGYRHVDILVPTIYQRRSGTRSCASPGLRLPGEEEWMAPPYRYIAPAGTIMQVEVRCTERGRPSVFDIDVGLGWPQEALSFRPAF